MDDRPVLTAPKMIASAIGGVVTAALTGAIAVAVAVPAIIALLLAASDPSQALYVASIGLGTAPGFVRMAWLVRSWERAHAMRLVGPTRSMRTSRRTTYYAIPAGVAGG